MKRQPQEKIRSWEEMTAKLLQLYAQEMMNLCKEHIEGKDLMENDQRRADIRFKIIEIGATLDETEKNYNNLLQEYGKQEV